MRAITINLRKLLAVITVLASASAYAQEVTLPYKGLTLNANLELAVGKQLSDGVILITHGGLAHREMELIVYLQKTFKERGYNTLAMNLSLGINNRHGMYDCAVTHRHTNEDAADEIGVWLHWLNQQGAGRIVLFAHSRGGAQAALYLAQHENPVVKAVVLMAPATHENTDAADYLKRSRQALAPAQLLAQQLIKSGKRETVMRHVGLMNCTDTSATAKSFNSYYGINARVDTPSLIPNIKPPLLVIVAGSDEVVVGLDKKIASLADGKQVQMKVIEGSDHTFRDLSADDAVDAVSAFLKGLGNVALAP